MPIETQSPGSTSKPITPALSSRFRTSRTPLAPRLAGTIPLSPAAATRKDLSEKTLSPLSEQGQRQHLNGNITPRSGARSTRISTESPASPVTSRRLSANSSISGMLSSTRQGNPVSSPSRNAPNQSQPVIKQTGPTIPATRRGSNSSSVSKKDEEPTKFFRANEAKTTPMFQSSKSTLSPRPPATSFLKTASPRTISSAPASSVRSSNQNQKDGGFVRANDVQTRLTRSPVLMRKQSTTSVASANSAKILAPELLRSQTYPIPLSQTNPRTKVMNQGVTPTTKPSPPPKRTPAPTSPAVVPPSSPSDRRRSFGSSISNSFQTRPMLHRKSASVSSFGPPPKFVTLPQVINAQRPESTWMSPSITMSAQQPAFPISSPESLSPRSTSLASSKTMGTSVTSDTDISDVSKVGLPLPPPSQAEATGQMGILQQLQSTPLAQAQMQAANARRERKVLDLEISNSSLLAINKTLEKELRKQSAELRRFRRLSRSGRLSFAPSHRSVSGQSALSLDTLQEQSEDDEDDDYSDEDGEDSDMDDLDIEGDGHLGDSPGGSTARARRRARDEKRLMLDLSQHQQLLVDSQKLSQSIRKCLSISEDLIKEGNQALNYKVGIGDLKLGGRVLSAEEVEIDIGADSPRKPETSSRRGLLSPSVTRTEIEEATLWLADQQVSGEVLDRYMHDVHS